MKEIIIEVKTGRYVKAHAKRYFLEMLIHVTYMPTKFKMKC
jgi:hypothetical protein